MTAKSSANEIRAPECPAPTTAAEQGTFIVSQPKPATGDLPNIPALGVRNIHTGVVTKIDTTFGSPKGLLFVNG